MRTTFDLPPDREILVIGHDNADFDSLAASFLLADLFCALGYTSRAVIPGGTDPQAAEQVARYGYCPAGCQGQTHPDDCLFLVDHSRTSHPGQVVGCMDHHPVAEEPAYRYVQIEAASSTTRMVQKWFTRLNVPLSDAQLAMTVFSIYRDTQSLRSRKYDPADDAFLTQTIERLGLDREALTREGYGMADPTLPAGELAFRDMKVFTYGTYRVGTSALMASSLPGDTEEEIWQLLAARRAAEGLDLWIFMHTDPLSDTSQVYYLGQKCVVKKYDFLVSRAVDIMPKVEIWLSGQKTKEKP